MYSLFPSYDKKTPRLFTPRGYRHSDDTYNSQGLILQNKKKHIMTFDSTAKKQIDKLSTLSIRILQ